jgi:hypothetical protein
LRVLLKLSDFDSEMVREAQISAPEFFSVRLPKNLL